MELINLTAAISESAKIKKKNKKNSGFSPTFRQGFVHWVDATITAWKLLWNAVCLQKKWVNLIKINSSTISRKSERDLIRVFENVSDYNLGLWGCFWWDANQRLILFVIDFYCCGLYWAKIPCRSLTYFRSYFWFARRKVCHKPKKTGKKLTISAIALQWNRM